MTTIPVESWHLLHMLRRLNARGHAAAPGELGAKLGLTYQKVTALLRRAMLDGYAGRERDSGGYVLTSKGREVEQENRPVSPASFQANRPWVIENGARYAGEYVVLHDGTLLDHDTDLSVLLERLKQNPKAEEALMVTPEILGSGLLGQAP